MRSYFYKFGFLGILIIAGFLVRAGYYPVSQSAADAVSIAVPRDGSQGVVAANMAAVPSGNVQGGLLADVGATTANDAGTPVISDVGMSPFAHTGDAPAPVFSYHEALIADVNSGAILFGDHDNTRWPLASLSKLMTATIAVDSLDINQKVTVTPDMLAVDPTDTTLKVGDTYTVSDMLNIMLLRSSNVAAEALAGLYGRDRFLALMNARAAELGMGDTYYRDPSGLSPANQSTADNLLLLVRKIYADCPQIFAITRKPRATVTNLATDRKIVVTSINNFAGQSDFLGGKTGYTDTADGNLLSIFKYENRPVLVIIMGTDEADRFTNTTALYNWFKQNFK